ncbi:MAG TPA: hypothetical protein VHZ56_07115 [Devosia sp.]|jgi:hypothetical protein|nr:hypothetical protein [Devosia sp.]
MKKILIVAALVAATAVPAAPSYAADMKTDMSKMSPMCFFLPLLPDCLSEWKDMGKGMKMTPMAPPKMMMMPKCTPAKAGAAYMFDCK